MGYINLPPSLTLRFTIIVMGFTATASQILIIRELIVIFQGNELFIGIILAYWLIFQAIGSYYMSNRLDTVSNHVVSLSSIQLAMGFLCVVVLLLIRFSRYLLGISTGEVLGIHYVLLLGFFTLLPVTLMGAIFPIACKNFREFAIGENYPAKVYFFESIGSFIAGIAFSFYFLYTLNSVELALIILALNLCSVTFYLRSRNSGKRIKYLSVSVLILLIASFFISLSVKLNAISANILWYEHTLVENRNSPYSNISIVKQEDQYTVFLNGSPYSVIPFPEISIEELAHFSMLFHEKPENILVMGSGFGGLIEEIYKHKINKIDYVEPDPMLIESLQKLLIYQGKELISDKINTHMTEGRLFLRKTSSFYDVVIINLSLPSTLQLNRYYSAEFFQLVKSRLRKNGIVVTKLPGSELFLPENLRKLNCILYKTLNYVFPYVRVIAGDQNIFIASHDPSVTVLNQEILIERIKSRNIKSTVVSEWYIRYKLDNPKFKEIERSIISDHEQFINKDYHPKAVYETILYLNSALNPYVLKVFIFWSEIRSYHYLLFIFAVFTFVFIFQSKKREIFLPYVIATTGFMSMLLSILLILLFQINFGNIYHYIGMLTSLFMLGSALGSYLGVRISGSYLIKIEMGILLLICLLYLFTIHSTCSIAKQLMIFSAIGITGLVTGMEFPLVLILSNNYKTKSSLAGKFYAFDLFGAFLGSVLPAVIFIPLLGIKDTLLITFVIKFTSFTLTLNYFLKRKN